MTEPIRVLSDDPIAELEAITDPKERVRRASQVMRAAEHLRHQAYVLRQKAVLAAVAANPGLTLKELAKDLGIHPSALSNSRGVKMDFLNGEDVAAP